MPRLSLVPSSGHHASHDAGPDTPSAGLANRALTSSYGPTHSLSYHGVLSPREAWSLMQSTQCSLIDVRTEEELAFVGRIPGAIHLPWRFGIEMRDNPEFIPALRIQVPLLSPVAFICRSGNRSHAAAVAAVRAGYTRVYNVSEGFEGRRDAQGHRNVLDGWRYRGLPWLQS